MSQLATPQCEERLALLVRQRTGIRILDHQLATLRRTLAEACVRFDYPHCDAYLAALGGLPANSPEHEHLIAGITVGESYFFRDQSQIDLLRGRLLPELIACRRASGDLQLRIWSAGCSEGQELYTLAILLHELLPDIQRWRLHLLGTDINANALSKAIAGRYGEWSFRAMPDSTRQSCFQQVGDKRWMLLPELRRGTRFAYLNLREDQFPSILTETTAMDMILCRNVFIYFDPLAVAEVMAKFHASLADDGVLLLGPSDLVDSTVLEGFVWQGEEGGHYLRRAERAGAPAEPAPRPPRPAPPRAAPVVAREVAPRREEGLPPPRALPPGLEAYADIVRLLGGERWREARGAVEARLAREGGSALLHQFHAKALANLGQGREALEACDRAIALDATDKHTHFLRAMILLELNRLSAAEDALRQTLFLDRGFVEAHYQLGMLQLRRGERAAGVKSLRNALQVAEQARPERRLHDAAGMDHQRMATLLRHALDIYS